MPSACPISNGMNAKEFFHSSAFKGLLVGIIAVTAVLTIFEAGVFVGRHQASFDMHEGDAYFRVVTHRSGGPFAPFMPAGGNVGDHGASGVVVSIALPTMVVADSQNAEKTVVLDDDTIVRSPDGDADASDIRTGDFAVVLGAPDSSGRIQAKFIRILPPASSTPAK